MSKAPPGDSRNKYVLFAYKPAIAHIGSGLYKAPTFDTLHI